jgi:hypothetical protein
MTSNGTSAVYRFTHEEYEPADVYEYVIGSYILMPPSSTHAT